MKTTINLISILFLVVICKAQGTLQFNQVLIITNVQTAVPAGKVWKVTSVYGAEFTINQCVSNDASFDWLGVKCVPDMINSPRSVRLSYYLSQLSVNGVS